MEKECDILSCCLDDSNGIDFMRTFSNIVESLNVVLLILYFIVGSYLLYRALRVTFLTYYYFLEEWRKDGYILLISSFFMILNFLCIFITRMISNMLSSCDCKNWKTTLLFFFLSIWLNYLILYCSFIYPILIRLKTRLCEEYSTQCDKTGYDREESRIIYRLTFIFGALVIHSFPICTTYSTCMLINTCGNFIIFLAGVAFQISEMRRLRPKTRYLEEKKGVVFVIIHILPYFVLFCCIDPLNGTSYLPFGKSGNVYLPYNLRFLSQLTLLLLVFLKLFSESVKVEPWVIQKGFLQFIIKTFNFEKEEKVLEFIKSNNNNNGGEVVVLDWIKEHYSVRLRCVFHEYDKYLDDYHRLYGGGSVTKKMKSYVTPYVVFFLALETVVVVLFYFLFFSSC